MTAGGAVAIIWEWMPDQGQFRLVKKLKHNRPLTHAVFGTDKPYVLTADAEGTTYLWNVKGLRPLVTKYHPGQTIIQIVGRQDGNARVYLIGNEVRRATPDPTDPSGGPIFRRPTLRAGWPGRWSRNGA